MIPETTELKLCNRPLSNVIELLGRSWTLQLIMTLGLSTSALRYSEIKKHESSQTEVNVKVIDPIKRKIEQLGIDLLKEKNHDRILEIAELISKLEKIKL